MKKMLAAALSIFVLMGVLPLRAEAAGLEETGTDAPVSVTSSQDTSGGDAGAAPDADPSAADADAGQEQVNAAGESAAEAAPVSAEISNEIQAVPAAPEAAPTEGDTIHIEAAGTATMQLMKASAPEMQSLGAAATYTVTITTNSADPKATVTGGGTYSDGDIITVTAAASEGYEFDKWIKNNQELSEGSSFKLTVTENVSLLACFKKQTFDFPIEADKVVGGTYKATAKVIYGESVNLEATASTGYHFNADWMRSDNSGESYEQLHGISSSFSNITTATRIYPVFIENQYYVIFSALSGGSGSQMPNQQFKYNESKALSANTYTRDGYSFAGWNTLPSPTAQDPGVHFEDGQIVSKLATENNQSVTLYAQWQPENYTITYDLAEGSFPAGTEIPSSYTIQSGPISIPDPIRSNYTFVGWTSGDFDGKKYDIVIPTGSTGNKEYTANWQGESAEIAFNCGAHGTLIVNGSPATSVTVTVPSRYGDAMPIFNLTQTVNVSGNTYSLSAEDGYVFNGWKDAGSNAPGDTVTGSAAYTAQWVPADNIHYTVNHIKMGIQGGMYTAVQTETAQNTVGTTGAEVSVTPIVYPGYHFVPSISDKVSNTSGTIKADGSLVLNLYYMPNQYTVQLNANGGYNTDPQGSASVNVNFTYGGNKKLASFWFARTGYTISGWNANADGTGVSYPVDQDIPDLTAVDGGSVILYAQWQPISYKVEFSSNHDTPAVTEQTMTYGVSAQLPENMYTRPGYHFTGWSRQSWNTTDLQQPGTEVINLTEQAGSTVSFYAQWEENAAVTITYTAGTGGTVRRTEESVAPVSGNPVGGDASASTGYEFVNWTDQDNNTVSEIAHVQPAQIDGIYLPNVYTAHFRPVVYVINYSHSGNDVTIGNNPSTYTVETPDITLADASRPGYEFTGWTGGGQVTATKGLVIPKGTVNNLTFYANFSLIHYSITYNLNGGSLEVAEPSTYTTDRLTPLPVPSRDGYEFLGWKYSGSETLIKDRAIARGSTGDKVLDAVWEAKESSFRFYTNGGTLVSTVVGKTDASVADTAMPTTAKDGYFFAGWYDNSVFRGSRVSSLPEKFPVSGIIYYAKWLKAFDAQPEDRAIMEGQTASFQISSSVASVSYQWQYRESAEAEWKNVDAGTGGNTAVYTTDAAGITMSGYQYRCAAAGSGETVFSSAAALTVKPKADVRMSLSASKSEIVYGESVTYTLEFQSTDPALTYPLDGTITFYRDTVKIGETADVFNARIEQSFTPGDYTIRAVYSGNEYYNAAETSKNANVARRQLAWDTSDLSAVKSADGNTNATVSGTLKVSGEIKAGDAGFKYTDLTGTYDSAEAGTRIVTAAYKAAGLSDNYALPAEAPVFTGTINKVVSLAVPSEVSDPSKYQLVQEIGISEVPEALKDDPNLNKPAKIEAMLKVKVEESADTSIPTANIEIYDVRLLFSEDGGKTWTSATEENFPANGITAILPYPEGTNASSFNFVITHMFTTGEKAGTTENLSYIKTPEGLQVHVSSLSPFAIGYVELPAAPSAGTAAEKKDLWCITYLDSRGNTVSVQWVETGKAPVKPAGYSYPDIFNVSANQDVRPIAGGNDKGYKVPDTADKSSAFRISELWLMLVGILLTAGALAHLRKRRD